jgi:hypothetical protein
VRGATKVAAMLIVYVGCRWCVVCAHEEGGRRGGGDEGSMTEAFTCRALLLKPLPVLQPWFHSYAHEHEGIY